MNRKSATCIAIGILLIGILGVFVTAEEPATFQVGILDGGWGLLAWLEEFSIYPVDPVEQTLGPLAATFSFAQGPIEVYLPAGEYEMVVRVPYLAESASYGRVVVEEHHKNIVDLRTYEFPKELITY